MHTHQVGDKVLVQGIVIFQRSVPKMTPVGLVYSHEHLIKDADGRLYQYRGSSLFPLNNQVAITATIKYFAKQGSVAKLPIIGIKAPKPVRQASLNLC